jgi:hypothetical protein
VEDQRRRGSTVSDKLIRLSVQKGRLVEVSTATQKITGYICGLDDYHYSVVPREFPSETYLVSKGSTTVRIFNDQTLENEPDELKKLIEVQVEAFRKSISRDAPSTA